ncbi:MAG TPA: L-ribulose-5-phosphate 4-epimerase [Armatimonadota bacterium]|nr:L-ribulose-5-phosphate 4-epimerase [Armatimonadota bacterium]HOP80368.1 L-ribulose-5-phosphate 4-epimerase [Armatimonadota bacterium]
MLEELKSLICQLNKELPKNGLVTMTSGNVSGRDKQTGLVVIKPSGLSFELLKPEDMVVVDLEGNVVDGTRKPSVDTLTHLYIYRHREDVGGIVHTHSNYATSFAALGKPIPAVLTAIADEFGGPIPCAPYCQIGEEQIGKAVVEHIGQCPAILLQNHGVFTIGPNPESALKAAVMLEDVAKTVHLAMLRGNPIPIPQEEVERGHNRYINKYGQGGC